MLRSLTLCAFSCSLFSHGLTWAFDSGDDDAVVLLQRRSTALKGRETKQSRGTISTVFVAGLEGSGHHLWFDLVEKFYQQEKFGYLPFDVRETWFPATVTDSSTGLVREVTWQCEHRWTYDDMELGVELFENITNHLGHNDDNENYNEDVIWILPRACLSYPCGGGGATHEQKRDDFAPRADWLAEAAGRVDGIELHIAFLYRPLEELLVSNCIHRQMEDSCDLYVDTLVTNAGALLGQLRAMDAMADFEKPLVKCLRYGDLDNFAEGLGHLFDHRMSFTSIVGDIWKPNSTDMDTDHHYDENPRDMVPNWDKLVKSLEHMDKELSEACAQAGSHPSHPSPF